MKYLLLAAAAASLAIPAQAQEATEVPSPGKIAAAAPAKDWIAIPASDLLVVDLTPDAKGKARRVVIQLMPAPFSQGWIGNIRKLAAARWWDGTSVNRVQDNYVAQWGDATEKKPLPEGLVTVPESEYSVLPHILVAHETRSPALPPSPHRPRGDAYAEFTGFVAGWPVAYDHQSEWPVHCYGMVGVGRNMSPDTGSGAELYAVIGHAPRHLDRNIALVGRVISGIEYLSSLQRRLCQLCRRPREPPRSLLHPPCRRRRYLQYPRADPAHRGEIGARGRFHRHDAALALAVGDRARSLVFPDHRG